MSSKIRIFALAGGVLIIITIVLFAIFGKTNTDSDGYYSVSQTKWPSNSFTEKIPKFEGEIYSVLVNDSSTAVFARNIEQSTADEYMEKLSEHDITVTGDYYPKKAEIKNTYVVFAYNSEEKNFSITFTNKEEPVQ